MILKMSASDLRQITQQLTSIKKSKLMIIGSTQSLAKLSSTLVFSIEDVSLEKVYAQSYKYMYLGVVSIRT